MYTLINFSLSKGDVATLNTTQFSIQHTTSDPKVDSFLIEYSLVRLNDGNNYFTVSTTIFNSTDFTTTGSNHSTIKGLTTFWLFIVILMDFIF